MRCPIIKKHLQGWVLVWTENNEFYRDFNILLARLNNLKRIIKGCNGNPLLNYFKETLKTKDSNRIHTYTDRLLKIYNSDSSLKIKIKKISDPNDNTKMKYSISGAGLKKKIKTNWLNFIQAVDFFRKLIYLIPILQLKYDIVEYLPDIGKMTFNFNDIPYSSRVITSSQIPLMFNLKSSKAELDTKWNWSVESFEFESNESDDDSNILSGKCPKTYLIQTGHGDWSLELNETDPRYFDNVYDLDRYWFNNFKKCPHPLGNNWDFQEIKGIGDPKIINDSNKSNDSNDGFAKSPDEFKELHKLNMKLLKNYKNKGSTTELQTRTIDPIGSPVEKGLGIGTLIPLSSNETLYQ